jgi:hypothetical protein
MSPKNDVDVAELVEKYRRKYPNARRALLRETIRLRLGQKRFTVAVKRRLDRKLKKAFEREPISLIQSNGKSAPLPRLAFVVTQGQGPSKRQLPQVGFNMINPNGYPLKVRLEVRVILGGRNLGLIQSRRGYYNGKAEIGLEPSEGFLNGSFSVPEECVHGDKELTIEVRSKAIYLDNREYTFLPKSWTYIRKENSWFYEPRGFTMGSD